METIDHCQLCQSDRIEIFDPVCNLQRCRSCGFVFDSPRPTLEELVAFYSKPTKYDQWISNERARDDLWMRRLKKLHSIRPNGSLLDVGTGIGQFLHYARNMYFPVAGTEVSESAIRIARQKYELELARGTLDTIDWQGKTFDVITLFHVLEHVPDPLEQIFSCRRLLNPNGILLIAVPNELLSIKSKVKRLMRLAGVKRFANIGKRGLPRIELDGSVPEIHLSHFTPKVLQICLQRCGFRILDNGLDPYYAATGIARLFHGLHYQICSVIRLVLRKNVYDTIWVVAEYQEDKG